MCVPVISSGTCDNQRIQTYTCLPVLTWGVGKSKRPFRFSCGFANQGVCRRTAHLFPKVILHVLFLMVLPLKSTGDSSFSYLHSHTWWVNVPWSDKPIGEPTEQCSNDVGRPQWTDMGDFDSPSEGECFEFGLGVLRLALEFRWSYFQTLRFVQLFVTAKRVCIWCFTC